MPGCAGEYKKPIVDWIMEGLSCNDCAWEKLCKDYTDINSQKPIFDIPSDFDIQIQTEIPE